MAFACDLTRVGSLMFTMFQSHMNMFAADRASDATSTSSATTAIRPARGRWRSARCIAWHMKHFAYLIGKLRDTPEGGGTLLDNIALVFLHEGGHGLDTATGEEEQLPLAPRTWPASSRAARAASSAGSTSSPPASTPPTS